MPFQRGVQPVGRVPVTPIKRRSKARELALEHVEEAIATLADAMRNGESLAVRLHAANCLLDRAEGKPGPRIEEAEARGENVAQLEEERRKKARETVRLAFARVTEAHPELDPRKWANGHTEHKDT